MTQSLRLQILLTPILFAVLVLVGCGGGGSSGSVVAPGGGTPQPQSTLDSGSSASLDAQTSISDTSASLSLADPVDAGTFALLDRGAQDQIEANPSPTPTPNPCVSESPIPVIDANHNGIPDNETWTYTACTRPGPDGTTHTLSGIVNVKDTSSGSTTAWVRTTKNYFTTVSGGNGPNYTDVLNGSSTHTISNNATTQTLVDNFSNQIGETGTPSVTTVKQTIVFNANGGATISPTKMPPSGTMTITGTREVMTEKNGAATSDVIYTTTTPTALTYDATCKTPPRITAGVVMMTSGNHSITLSYNGCGHAPAVTKT